MSSFLNVCRAIQEIFAFKATYLRLPKQQLFRIAKNYVLYDFFLFATNFFSLQFFYDSYDLTNILVVQNYIL